MPATGPVSEDLALWTERGAMALRSNGLVAIPTDTQYALSALASSGAAVMHCFAAKQRPDSEAMPILIPDLSWLDRMALDSPEWVRTLAGEVWPGGVTLVLRRHPLWRSLAVPDETVALRIPNHPLALAVLQAVNEPLTGSSANHQGEAPAVDPDRVCEIFGDDVTVLPTLDTLPEGTASTILDCVGTEPRILRAGALDEAHVADLLARHAAAQGR